MGAEAAFDARQDVPALVRQANDGRNVDLAIVCAGALPAFHQALAAVDRGGTVLCFAPTLPGVELAIPINDFWRNSITVLPSYANSPHDAEVAIELIRSGRIDCRPMVTHKLSLAETQEGFRLVASGGESMKVIIEPQR